MTATYGTFQDTTTTVYANAAALTAVATATLYNGYRAQVDGLGVFKLDKTSQEAANGTTVIASDTQAKWLKDLTPSLLLNSSNHIDGSQLSAVGSQTLDNGTAAAPSLSFTNDTDSGLYLVGAGEVGVSIGGALSLSFVAGGLNLATSKVLSVAGTQVVGARQTGWVAFVGAATTDHSGINAGTITATDGNIQALAQAVNGIQTALTAHGLIGA